MPLIKVSEKGQVTLPVEIREELHLKKGDLLEATRQGNTIVLKPKVIVDRADIDAAFEQGMKDYREGRGSGPFTAEELERHLS